MQSSPKPSNPKTSVFNGYKKGPYMFCKFQLAHLLAPQATLFFGGGGGGGAFPKAPWNMKGPKRNKSIYLHPHWINYGHQFRHQLDQKNIVQPPIHLGPRKI